MNQLRMKIEGTLQQSPRVEKTRTGVPVVHLWVQVMGNRGKLITIPIKAYGGQAAPLTEKKPGETVELDIAIEREEWTSTRDGINKSRYLFVVQ